MPSTAAVASLTAEHSYIVDKSPRTLKRRCDELVQQLHNCKRSLYNAERREYRAKVTIAKVLEELKNEKLVASETQSVLKAFDNLPVHLFRKESASYTEEQRQFATTLHYYSPKAYEFCRKSLQLPAESTLRRWLSVIDYRPGFSEEVFASLRLRLFGPDSWQYKSCTVMIDGMSLRKHIDWDSKHEKMVGFTDLGAGSIDADGQEEATEVIVIMAVGLTGHWKVTLGYFLIAGINAVVQAQLIRSAFIKLHECGIRGIALVMDGHATNQAMVNELGGVLSPHNLKTTFSNPAEATQLVYIFFDACHMLKLLRNALEAMKQICLPGIGTARWSDIVNLHELQHTEGLRAGNKLTAAHIQFQQQKMKVRLAAQTLSASVAKALEFLQTNNCPKFSDTVGTQKFIYFVDRLFDVFNSRSPKATGYKQALTPQVFAKVTPFLKECRELLLNMADIAGKKVCEGRRHMAALGFVVNIDSLLQLGQEILLTNSSPYHQRYLLTYKLSQDHLELYFGCIRRMGGWNNNPSAKQFGYAYRTLLSHASVSGSSVANIIQQDHTDLLHLTPQTDGVRDDHFEPAFAVYTGDHDYCTVRRLSNFVSNVIEYIAGWVVRKLMPKIACADCIGALVMPAGKYRRTESLLEVKNNGGLVRPSDSVLLVLQQAEKVLRELVNVQQVKKSDHWGHILESKVLERVPRDVFPELADHFRNSQSGIDDHFTDLVRNLCRTFVSLRRFHAINLTNQQLRGRSVRHVLTKTILFKNQ